MITAREIQLIIPYAPMDNCENIADYITGVYKRKYSYIYELDYEIVVTEILERASGNYNPKLGHLIRYVKNTLSLKLKDYVKRHHVNTVIMDESIITVIPEDIESYDLTQYSDAVIKAIYNVTKGKGTKREKEIVMHTFKIEGD